MKIFAVTDIHGKYKIVEKAITREQPDLIIIGGDLTTCGSISDVSMMIENFKRLNKNIFAVAGNMDNPFHEDVFLKLGVSLNARGVLYNEIGLFGVSSAPFSKLNTPYEISENQIYDRIISGYKYITEAKLKILVSHAPPHGTKLDIIRSGDHVGSKSVREFIEDKQPDLVICGHIHESRGIDEIGKTKIVNCGSGAEGFYANIEVESDLLRISLMG